MSDKTPETFSGAVEFLMNLLKELYPNAQKVFMTPARCGGDLEVSPRPMKHSSAKPLKAYVEVIKEKGIEHNIPVLDLYENLGINPNNEEERERYTTDGLHFNDEGHKIIAKCLTEFLQKP